jgi:hypothetical protein
MNVQAILRFPVVCPSCGDETLFSAPARTIADALSSGTRIALRADCCGLLPWFASELEIEQIREYADIHNLSTALAGNNELPVTYRIRDCDV